MFLSSPRTSLHRLLRTSFQGVPATDLEVDASVRHLRSADADNRLHRRQLYLVLDLDETLVYSSKVKAGAALKGNRVFVSGNAYDVVQRPGLQEFLATMREHYVMFLYTMGDEEYTQAVLEIIDPASTTFRGTRTVRVYDAHCAWQSGLFCRAVRRRHLRLAHERKPDAQVSRAYWVRAPYGTCGR